MRLDVAWEELTEAERETFAASLAEPLRPRASARLVLWRDKIPDAESTWRTKYDTYDVGPLKSAFELRLPVPNAVAIAWAYVRSTLQRFRYLRCSSRG